MITLLLLAGIGVVLGILGFSNRGALDAALSRRRTARAERTRRTGETAGRLFAYAAQQGRQAVFGPRERRWRGWIHFFRTAAEQRRARKQHMPAPAPAAATPEPTTIAGAIARIFALALISMAALANLAVEAVLVALTFSEYLGSPSDYPPALANLFSAPAMLIAVSVLAGTTVWGILALESFGFDAPTFDTAWVSILAPPFVALGIFVVAKAGEVRGLVGMPTTDGASAFQVLQAAASAKMDISIAVAVLAVGTSVIGMLALSRFLALVGGAASAVVIAWAAAVLLGFGMVRDALARLAVLPLELFLYLTGVPQAEGELPQAERQPLPAVPQEPATQ